MLLSHYQKEQAALAVARGEVDLLLKRIDGAWIVYAKGYANLHAEAPTIAGVLAAFAGLLEKKADSSSVSDSCSISHCREAAEEGSDLCSYHGKANR